MKLFLFSLVVFAASQSLANAELKFEDTKLTVHNKLVKFSAVPGANSFAYNSENLQAVVTRNTPDIPVNEKTVKRTWADNLKTLGKASGAKDCKKFSRFHYLCSQESANQKLLLSYSRKDIVAVVLSGTEASKTKVTIAKSGK